METPPSIDASFFQSSVDLPVFVTNGADPLHGFDDTSSPFSGELEYTNGERPQKKFRSKKRRMLVQDIMAKNPLTVTPTSTLADAVRIMAQKRIHRLPVVDNGKIKFNTKILF
jgi:hypothetical protein